MQILYSSEDRVMLYLLKSELAEKDINCIIKNEAPAGQAAGEVPPVLVRPELWILDDNRYAEAKAIIDNVSSDLLLQAKKPWKCPECGEELEGQFDVCWKCGHSKSVPN